jgi:hypothetical protein
MRLSFIFVGGLCISSITIPAKAEIVGPTIAVTDASYFSIINISTPEGTATTGDVYTQENLYLNKSGSVGKTIINVGVPDLSGYSTTNGETDSQT